MLQKIMMKNTKLSSDFYETNQKYFITKTIGHFHNKILKFRPPNTSEVEKLAFRQDTSQVKLKRKIFIFNGKVLQGPRISLC